VTSSRIAAIRLFQPIDQLTRAFSEARGFSQSSFMTSVSPHSTLGGRPEREELTRSFHCDRGGTFAFVRVHGTPRSPWLRGMTGRLTRAGYVTTWTHEDGAGLRRWLYGTRQITAELCFLRGLGETGSPARWAERAPSSPPGRQPRRSHRAWACAVDAAREAGIEWHVCAADFSQRVALPQFEPGRFVLDVSAISFSRVSSGPSIVVSVTVFDSSPARRRVPTRIAAGLSRDLGRAGYVDDPFVEGRFSTTKRLRGPSAAVRECVRTFVRASEHWAHGRPS